jgi:hypothetical protein
MRRPLIIVKYENAEALYAMAFRMVLMLKMALCFLIASSFCIIVFFLAYLRYGTFIPIVSTLLFAIAMILVGGVAKMYISNKIIKS